MEFEGSLRYLEIVCFENQIDKTQKNQTKLELRQIIIERQDSEAWLVPSNLI